MRALVWLIGLVELARLMPGALHQVPAVGWLWVAGIGVWLFAGAVLVALPLLRLAGKVGGGGSLSRPRAGTVVQPPPRKDD